MFFFYLSPEESIDTNYTGFAINSSIKNVILNYNLDTN